MITCSDLKGLARTRVKDAEALIRMHQYSGAYYLSGYAVECALKACIAKKTRRYEFPDKQLVNKSYTHNLEELIGLSGLKTQLNTQLQADNAFEVNWSLVKQWSENSRYEKHTSRETRDLFLAITEPHHGVLAWIQRYW